MCQACEHPERMALEQDIRAGMAPSPVAKKYGLRHHAVVIQHTRLHMNVKPAIFDGVNIEPMPTGTDIELARVDEVAVRPRFDGVDIETPMTALQPALPYVRRAASLIKNRDEYEHIVATLNDALQSENMGL